MKQAWRVVHADFTSSRGYRWPYPGGTAVAPGPILDHDGQCPQAIGDGLCVAKTWRGAASGGIPAHTALIVEYDEADVLGEDADKIRVREARVVDVIDVHRWVRDGWFTGANLTHAYLAGADLTGADLTDAYLAHADLAHADLTHANLTGADLAHANLARANLTGANLTGANLTDADLAHANLAHANLARANLAGANLTDAYLTDARYNATTIWPVGFDPHMAGAIHR